MYIMPSLIYIYIYIYIYVCVCVCFFVCVCLCVCVCVFCVNEFEDKIIYLVAKATKNLVTIIS